MEASALARELEEFLVEAPRAAVLEDGAALFDFATARYSITADHGRCLLHIWSEERNAVRRVLDCQRKADALLLTVRRFGQSKPSKLTICADHDRRTPAARKTARARYQRTLERVLRRAFGGMMVEGLTSAMDLERSFGPVYTRGVLRQGRSAFAVFGVGSGETQPAIDGSLTIALLWLDLCRQRATREVVEGLKLLVPPGTSAIVRSRMANLDRGAAKYELYELDENAEELAEMDCDDRGNIITRLVQRPGPDRVRERFAASVEWIRKTVPEAEQAAISAAELSFRLYGLEFARARLSAENPSFRPREEIVFGAAPSEFPLTEQNAAECEQFLRRLVAARHPGADRRDPLFRMHPERWLESLVVRDVARLDARLDRSAVYSQVPAFSASDRAMIDVLTSTREGRLAVVELKADEDIHLPLQGLDYWARVRWHQQRGEFQRFGYFSDRQLSSEPPLLLLVAPALHVHPTTDAVFRYLSPEIDCELLGIHENWREELRVIFRKRRQALAVAAS